jgi:beta-glucuronidase
LWSEEYQAEIYKHQTETIAKCPYVKGMTPWILYDFHAARRQNKQQQGFNRKGLIDSDRKTKKLAFKVLADFYKTK